MPLIPTPLAKLPDNGVRFGFRTAHDNAVHNGLVSGRIRKSGVEVLIGLTSALKLVCLVKYPKKKRCSNKFISTDYPEYTFGRFTKEDKLSYDWRTICRC